MDSCDVVIIGSGIQGLCTAYYLKKRAPELEIMVLESEQAIGGRSTRRSAAMLTRLTGYRETTEMADESLRLYDQLCADLESITSQRVVFEKCGFVVIGWDESRADVEAEYEEHRDLGLDTILMSGTDVNEWSEGFYRYPNDAVACACQSDGYVQVEVLVGTLGDGLRRLGVKLVTGARVTDIPASSDEITSVALDDGEKIACRAVVNAAGIGADVVGAAVGREIGLIPSKKDLVSIPDVGQRFRGPIVESLEDGWYIRPDRLIPELIVVGVGRGTTIDIREALAGDPELSEDAIEQCVAYLRKWTTIDPALLDQALHPDPNHLDKGGSGWAGYRPLTPDMVQSPGRAPGHPPVYGKPPGAPRGFFESVGWGEFGITLGPFGGAAVADAILNDGLF